MRCAPMFSVVWISLLVPFRCHFCWISPFLLLFSDFPFAVTIVGFHLFCPFSWISSLLTLLLDFPFCCHFFGKLLLLPLLLDFPFPHFVKLINSINLVKILDIFFCEQFRLPLNSTLCFLCQSPI